MASVVTNLAKELMIAAVSGSDLKIALLNNVFSADDGSGSYLKDFNNWSELSVYETTGTNYIAGGVALSGTSAYSSSASDLAYFDGTSVIWNSSTITAYGLALYRSNSGVVISIMDFGGVKSSTAASFSIGWNNNNILEMVG